MWHASLSQTLPPRERLAFGSPRGARVTADVLPAVSAAQSARRQHSILASSSEQQKQCKSSGIMNVGEYNGDSKNRAAASMPSSGGAASVLRR